MAANPIALLEPLLAKQRIVSLATVSAAAAAGGAPTPRVRSVVFRGWLRDGGSGGPPRLLFAANRASAKMQELAANPHAEACCWFPDDWQQFRIAGRVSVARDDAVSAMVWRDISESTRAQFASESDMVVLVLDPATIDHLTLLRTWPHSRTLYTATATGDWQSESIDP